MIGYPKSSKKKQINKELPDKISAGQYRQMYASQTKKKPKYGNCSKTYNGRTYDSKFEARYAEELDYRIKIGEVKEWFPQVKIEIPINGKKWRNYYIDFKVILTDGTIIYTEVKGYETEVWKMKWDALVYQKDQILEPGAELIVIK